MYLGEAKPKKVGQKFICKLNSRNHVSLYLTYDRAIHAVINTNTVLVIIMFQQGRTYTVLSNGLQVSSSYIRSSFQQCLKKTMIPSTMAVSKGPQFSRTA